MTLCSRSPLACIPEAFSKVSVDSVIQQFWVLNKFFPVPVFITHRKTPRLFRIRAFNLKPGDDLLSHGETPHYHRRGHVSLLSSGWDQVVPCLYGRQANWLETRTVLLCYEQRQIYFQIGSVNKLINHCAFSRSFSSRFHANHKRFHV